MISITMDHMINLTNPGRKPKPNAWVTGPDPVTHVMYHNWARHRAQANFRKEPWHLDFKTWCEVWGDLFAQRGRTRDSVCMTRTDLDGGWTRDNVMIITREQHAQRQAQDRKRQRGPDRSPRTRRSSREL